METVQEFAKKLIELMEFGDYKIEVDEEHRHGIIFIHSHENIVKENLPRMLESFNYLIQLIAKKREQPLIVFDINNYRREREKLISELARAAARKVSLTKETISLPAMNSYERRLVHLELVAHPEVVTESIGLGKERYVIVKPVGENSENKISNNTSANF